MTVRAEVPPPGRAWLDDAVAQVRSDPARVRALFPAAGRRCGREVLVAGDELGLHWGTVDDVARAEMLRAMSLPAAELADEVRALYRYGDAAEKRGVLRALHLVDTPARDDGIGDRCVDLLEDALRSNDMRLVAAALGAYGASYLSASTWRHGVLKCLFLGVPLQAVAEIDRRADDELARMLAGFALERVTAGRDVPADVWRVLDRFPAAVDGSGLLDAARSPVRERREAARRALGDRVHGPF